MKHQHSKRLKHIERRLPAPRQSFVSWVLSLAEPDRTDLLYVLWSMTRFEEAGVGLLTEAFASELEPKESPMMGLCRLCQVDYQRMRPLLEKWSYERW